MSLATLFTIAKTSKQTVSLIDEIIKIRYIYSMEYYLAIRRMKFCHLKQCWKDLQYSMLIDLIQAEKDRCTMLCHIYHLKNKTKLRITYQKQTHRHKEQVSGYQWGGRKQEGQNRCRGFRDANYYV